MLDGARPRTPLPPPTCSALRERLGVETAGTASALRSWLLLEQLETRSADVVLVVDFSGDGQDPGIGALLDSPTYTRLPAVQAGQTHVVDGTRTVGAAWARMGAFLDVLEEYLPGARDDVVLEQ